MKWLLPLVFAGSFFSFAQAQNSSCYYGLFLEDTSGDGWGDNTLAVILEGDTSVFSLEEGAQRFVPLPVVGGDLLELVFRAGSSGAEEVGVRLLDADDAQLVAFEGPADGERFSTVVACPDCPNLPSAAVRIEEVRDVFADVAWPPLDSAAFYLLEIGLSGFSPGNGQLREAMNNNVRLDGLTQNRSYDFYLRTVCGTGDTTAARGPFSFSTLYTTDLGVVSILSPPVNCNNEEMDTIRIGIRNFGGAPQSLIPVNFSLNGELGSVNMPTDGVFTGVVGKDSIEIFEFDVQVNTMELGENVLRVWTDAEADSVRANDTLTYLFYTRFDLPLREDFEAFNGGGWDLGPGVEVGQDHNSGSRVLFARLFDEMPAFEALSPQLGFIAPGDSLVFDYRLVAAPNGDQPAQLSPGDSLLLEISTDCGETFTPVLDITADTHTSATDFAQLGVGLAPYAGEAIRIRFRGVRSQGDFFADIDNLNLLRCTNDFQPVVDITPTSGVGINNGAISITPQLGLPAYEYFWNTGDTTAVVDSLFSGDYVVTITDATGCTQTLSIFVDLATGIFAPLAADFQLRAAPNPTPGTVRLQANLPEFRDWELRIFNSMGQVVLPVRRGFEDRLDQTLQLEHLPSGLYIVRLQAGRDVQSLRLILR